MHLTRNKTHASKKYWLNELYYYLAADYVAIYVQSSSVLDTENTNGIHGKRIQLLEVAAYQHI